MPDPVQPSTAPITILVVEDHPIMRDALITVVETESDMRVVGQAADGYAAVVEALRCHPDVVIMDLFLPGQGGVAAITAIKEQAPLVQVLALTSATDEATFLAALQAGATGYLLKDSQRRDLIDAVRSVAQGIEVVAPQFNATLVQSVTRNFSLPETLTARERRVVSLVGAGATNQEIARELVVTESTVRTHIQHLLEKLELENRNQLVLYAVRTGLAAPGCPVDAQQPPPVHKSKAEGR